MIQTHRLYLMMARHRATSYVQALRDVDKLDLPGEWNVSISISERGHDSGTALEANIAEGKVVNHKFTYNGSTRSSGEGMPPKRYIISKPMRVFVIRGWGKISGYEAQWVEELIRSIQTRQILNIYAEGPGFTDELPGQVKRWVFSGENNELGMFFGYSELNTIFSY